MRGGVAICVFLWYSKIARHNLTNRRRPPRKGDDTIVKKKKLPDKEALLKQNKEFWGDFKKFITRGNVLDMAIGVIIGASFGKIVTSLVNDIINPFIGIFLKENTLDAVRTVITPEVLDEAGNVVTAEVAIRWGAWAQTIIDFLITAFCVFLLLRLVTRLRKLMEAAAEAKAAEEKAAAEAKAAAEKAERDAAAAALAAKQEALEKAQLEQTALLAEIRDLLRERK